MKAIYYIPILLCIFLFGCERVNNSLYRGDGEISSTGNYFISYGYIVKFDTLDFSKPFAKEFNISEFPKINKTLGFGIKTKSPSDSLENSLKGILSFKLISSEGKTLFDCSAPLKKWKFGSTYLIEEKMTDYFIYYFGREIGSFIDEKEQDNIAPMTLTVE